MKYHIVPLTASHKDEFIRLIRLAFSSDPLFEKLFANITDSKRKKRYEEVLLSFLFDQCLYLSGKVLGGFYDGRLVCAALLDVAEVPFRQRWLGWCKLLPAFAALLLHFPFKQGQFLNRYFLHSRRLMPHSPHYYLTLIGTLPDCQGKGFGKALIQQALMEAANYEHATGTGTGYGKPCECRALSEAWL
ncbi:GNAT family N-acetyltransferase [Bowmanella denitrificans]|uniref:GNAT family N-acetyltransferase n=1 Tax=Bowmanella denitrificans TaxID=366582 RepID=UPI000C9B40BE|nr:GNAT family N-acetyltransferase [Bowmanella denitrificans]